jgi:tRNA(fMet)-specific endonuclease VapC
MIFLLDTDTIIFMLRGLKLREKPTSFQRERARIAERIVRRARERENLGDLVGVSAITLAELEFGARESMSYEVEGDAIRRSLGPFAMLDFDAKECPRRYGEVRSVLEAAGKPIGSQDTFIAAHALALKGVLVTNNIAEFSRVPGLQCENWTL